MRDTSVINWANLTEEQLRNWLRDFPGTEFAERAKIELRSRGLSV